MDGGDERMVRVDTSRRSSAERLDRNVQGQLHSERVELGREGVKLGVIKCPALDK
jgi:hypothetical protein